MTLRITRPASDEPDGPDGLLAPIARYPDALVLLILRWSSAPDQVKKLNDRINMHPELKGTAARDAVTAEGFAPRFMAILLPQFVQMMTDEPDWTRDVANTRLSNDP